MFHPGEKALKNDEIESGERLKHSGRYWEAQRYDLWAFLQCRNFLAFMHVTFLVYFSMPLTLIFFPSPAEIPSAFD